MNLQRAPVAFLGWRENLRLESNCVKDAIFKQSTWSRWVKANRRFSKRMKTICLSRHFALQKSCQDTPAVLSPLQDWSHWEISHTVGGTLLSSFGRSCSLSQNCCCCNRPLNSKYKLICLLLFWPFSEKGRRHAVVQVLRLLCSNWSVENFKAVIRAQCSLHARRKVGTKRIVCCGQKQRQRRALSHCLRCKHWNKRCLPSLYDGSLKCSIEWRYRNLGHKVTLKYIRMFA